MNINPDYQREVVWNDKRQMDLIDSFFNNYYVPPLIFKVVSGVKQGTNERRKWRTCIDGKQRLTTIKRFFDGEIAYVDKQKNKWYYTEDYVSKLRKNVRLLSEEARMFIENVMVVNVEFESITEEQEEDMFQRVQLGMPLTPAEKLAALNGPMPAFINDLRRTFTNFGQVLGTKRSTDFKLVTQLVVLMYNRIEQEDDLKLKTTHQTIKNFLESKNPEQILTPAFRHQVRRVLSKYNDLIATYPAAFTHTFGNTKSKMRKFSPVEFLGVGVLVDVYPARPSRVLSEDIKTFRQYLREHLQDLRTNTHTWAHVMAFINGLEDARGYYAPERDNAKRARTTAGNTNGHLQANRFNPPAPSHQIPYGQQSVYNERQQQIMQERIANEERSQREAFQRVPHVGGRAPDSAGGVKERVANGGQKRTNDGIFIKRES